MVFWVLRSMGRPTVLMFSESIPMRRVLWVGSCNRRVRVMPGMPAIKG